MMDLSSQFADMIVRISNTDDPACIRLRKCLSGLAKRHRMSTSEIANAVLVFSRLRRRRSPTVWIVCPDVSLAKGVVHALEAAELGIAAGPVRYPEFFREMALRLDGPSRASMVDALTMLQVRRLDGAVLERPLLVAGNLSAVSALPKLGRDTVLILPDLLDIGARHLLRAGWPCRPGGEGEEVLDQVEKRLRMLVRSMKSLRGRHVLQQESLLSDTQSRLRELLRAVELEPSEEQLWRATAELQKQFSSIQFTPEGLDAARSALSTRPRIQRLRQRVVELAAAAGGGAECGRGDMLRLGKVCILGSCVTRDAFNDMPPEVPVRLSLYLARTTINSAIAPPLEGDWPFVGRDPVGFEQRTARDDIRKLIFGKIADDDHDWLLLDLIDERHATAVTGRSAFAVSSFMRDKIGEGAPFEFVLLKPDDPRTMDLTLKNLPVFIERIKEASRGRRIIVHEAYWAASYRTRDGRIVPFEDQGAVVRMNDLLRRCYGGIAETLGADRIAVDRRYLLGDELHRWSLSPFHYVPEYYQDFWNKLVKIVVGTPSRLQAVHD